MPPASLALLALAELSGHALLYLIAHRSFTQQISALLMRATLQHSQTPRHRQIDHLLPGTARINTSLGRRPILSSHLPADLGVGLVKVGQYAVAASHTEFWGRGPPQNENQGARPPPKSKVRGR